MQTISSLKEIIKQLSSIQLRDLFNFIGEIMSLNITATNLSNKFKESRFSSGEVCMHCGSTHVVKHGKVNDKQRYKCRDCNKTFNELTMSSLSYTKLPLVKWVQYAQCMIAGYSIVRVPLQSAYALKHHFICVINF